MSQHSFNVGIAKQQPDKSVARAGRASTTRLPKHPFCDLPDFRAITPAQSTRDAWLKYLRVAKQPYSLSAFTRRVSQWRGLQLKTQSPNNQLDALNPTGDEFVESERYWRNRSLPKTRVIALRNSASLRVANGALELMERLPLHLAPDGEPQIVSFNEAEARRGLKSSTATSMPKAIILPEHGWSVTAEAVKFCIAHDIALVSVASRTTQGEKGLISIVAGGPVADAALVRAQVRAKKTTIAREIVRQKIETCAMFGRLRPNEARQFIQTLDKARSIDRIVIVEARAAAAYWNRRRCEIRTTSRRWPANWSTFTTRNSAIGRNGPRHAETPTNALLNWSYAVVAGRLSVQLFARGVCLAIGYLHVDQPGRYSLAYDALELLRPIIDEKVFDFIGKTRFRMGDFLVAPSGKYKGEVRVAPELLKVFAPAVFVSNEDVSKAAGWMVETIAGLRQPHPSRPKTPGQLRRRPQI